MSLSSKLNQNNKETEVLQEMKTLLYTLAYKVYNNKSVNITESLMEFSVITDSNFDWLRKNKTKSSSSKLKLWIIGLKKDKEGLEDVITNRLSEMGNLEPEEYNIQIHFYSEIRSFYDLLITESELLLNELENPEVKESINPKTQKFKWKGTPSVFGYFFSQFVSQGYLEMPTTNGKPSYAKFARECYEVFDINTTVENLAKELNPGKQTITPEKTNMFEIPHIDTV